MLRDYSRPLVPVRGWKETGVQSGSSEKYQFNANEFDNKNIFLVCVKDHVFTACDAQHKPKSAGLQVFAYRPIQTLDF